MPPARQSFMSRWTPAEIMLAVLFLLAPLYYHANPGGDGLRIPHSPLVWLIALLFILYSLQRALNQNSFLVPRYFYLVLAFPLLATLSGFFSGIESPLNWLFRVLFIWGGLLFLFCLFQQRWGAVKIERIMYLLVLGGLAHALIGCLQIWYKLDLPFLKSPKGIPSGLFQQVNIEATFLVTVILIAFYLIGRPSLNKLRWYLQMPLHVTIALSTYVVTASGSRIGALALIFGLPIFLLARRKQLSKSKRVIVIALIAMLLGGIAASINGSSRVLEKTTAMQSGYSKDARFGIYAISLGLSREAPVFGHGIGSFPRVFQLERPEFFEAHNQAVLPPQMVTHPHNEMLLWLVEGGAMAFIGISLFVVGTLFAIGACGFNRGGAYFAMLLPFALHLQVEVPFYVSALPWFVFLFLLFLPFQHFQRNFFNTLSLSAQKLSSIAAWVMFSALLVLLLHTMAANWDFNKFMHAERNPDRHKMTFALTNPYLSDFAYEVEASSYLRAALALNNQAYLGTYAHWAQEKIKQQPSPLLMRNLILSQLGLGNDSEACKSYEFAKSIYPSNKYLSEKPRVCM